MRGAIFNLDEDMEAANNAECPKQGEICCPGKFVQPPPLECPSKTGENIKYVHMSSTNTFLTASAPLAVLYLTILLLHHSLFMKFVQLTIDGAEFGTEVPPGGIVWH